MSETTGVPLPRSIMAEFYSATIFPASITFFQQLRFIGQKIDESCAIAGDHIESQCHSNQTGWPNPRETLSRAADRLAFDIGVGNSDHICRYISGSGPERLPSGNRPTPRHNRHRSLTSRGRTPIRLRHVCSEGMAGPHCAHCNARPSPFHQGLWLGQRPSQWRETKTPRWYASFSCYNPAAAHQDSAADRVSPTTLMDGLWNLS